MRSFLFPGWGQLATDHVALGRALIVSTGLVVIGLLTVFLFLGPVEVAARLTDPDVLFALVLINLLVACMRIFATTHAWRAGGGHNWAVALFLTAIVTIPHATVAWMGLEARATLLTVFQDEPTVVARGSSTTTTALESTTTSTPATIFVLHPVPDPAPGEVAPDPVDTSSPPLWRPFGQERLNVLLLGGDAGPGRSGLRTDTMIVASVDPVSGDAALIGLPRNYGGIRFSDGSPFPGTMLNAVYGWGVTHPDAYGGLDPGASALIDVVQGLTGLEIDYFVLVDLTGFADVVDVLGGVTVDVPRPVDGPLYDPSTGSYQMVHIPAGEQVLDGGFALAYARARYGSSDYVRMGRQRCILAGLVDGVDLFDLITRLPDLLQVIEQKITTDLPLDMLPDLVRLASHVSSARMRMIGFDSTWGAGISNAGYVIPDSERIRAAVRLIVEGNETLSDGTPLSATESCA